MSSEVDERRADLATSAAANCDEDEDEKDSVVSRLKHFRPFTESQLLALHPIVELETSVAYVDTFLQVNCSTTLL